VAIEVLDGAGKSLSRVGSPPVYRSADWMPVRATPPCPAQAVTARLLLTLAGEARADLDAGSWAEVRNLRRWTAPDVALAVPGLGYTKPDQPWQATLRVGPPSARWVARLIDVEGQTVQLWEGGTADPTLARGPLGPGYYELRWSAVDDAGEVLREGRAAVACLPDFTAPASSPFAIDAGFSWGIIQRGPERAKRIAELLYRIGLRRTRDRLSVSQTMRERGRLELGHYAEAAKLQREAGLQVYTIMHDIPRWMATAPDEPPAWKQPPGDLRDLYAYFAAAAREMAGTVDAWELWNEPDISFFAGRAEEYAGIVKAGYLGVKAGNSNANVLLGSPAHALGPWVNLAFESGLADYYDTFNFHTYRAPETIPHDTAEFRELQQRYGADRPIWLTETGAVADPGDGDDLPGERVQAADYVQRYALAAEQRIAHVFAFYLQEWRQTGAPPFGVLRPDDTPRPALVALATLTRMLGQGQPLGRQTDLPPGVTALWFETGHGPTAVVWSDPPLDRPTTLAGTRWVGLFGAEQPAPERLSNQPVFLVADQAPAALQAPPSPPTPRRPDDAALAELQVVLDLRLKPARDEAWDTAPRKQPVKVVPGQALPAEAVVYNFGARPVRVRLSSALPEGWRLDGLRTDVDVSPGDRVVQAVTVQVGALPAEAPYRVRLAGEATAYRIAPAVAACAPATDRLQVEVLRRLGEATPAAERWSVSHNQPLRVVLTPAAEGLKYEATMTSPSGALGVRAALRDLGRGAGRRRGTAVQADVAAALERRLDRHLARGRRQPVPCLGGADGSAGEREVRLMWGDFGLNTGVSRDENGRLDLDQVDRVSFGTSARGPQMAGAFELGPIELFRLKRAP